MRNKHIASWSAVVMLLTALLITVSNRPTSATFFPWPVNPDTIKGLTLWLDASDMDGDGNYNNNPTDGAAVSEWKDKSGNAHDARVITGQSTGTFVGDTSKGINGQPTVRFDRISDSRGTVLRVPDVDIRATSTPKITIFSVYRPRTVVANNGVWGADNGNWDRFFLSYHPAFGNGKTDGIASLGPSQRGAVVDNAGVFGNERLLTVVYNGDVSGGVNQGPTNGSAVYFNGDLVRRFADSTHPTNAQSTFAIGWDGDNSVFDGDIAEVLIYRRVLSDEEIRDVNHYFSEKYSFKISSPETVPGKPVNLTATCDGATATVAFVAGADGGDPIKNYEYSTDGGRTWDAFRPAITASPLVVDGLASGQEHDIAIRAVNDIGPGEASEAATCAHNAPPTSSNGAPQTPDAPTNLLVTEVGEMTKVIFDEGDDGGSSITHYEHSINGDEWRDFSPAESASPVTFHNLMEEENYRIRIRAVNAVGPGAASRSVEVGPDVDTNGVSDEMTELPATGSSTLVTLLAALLVMGGLGLVSAQRRRVGMS